MSDGKTYSGSGTYCGYHVEVRIKPSMSQDARQLSESFIVTKDWKRVPVQEVPLWGVRNSLWEWDMYPHAKKLDLLRWETACAIAAQVAAGHHMNSYLLEFRFVEVEVEHTYSYRDTRVAQPFDYSTAMKAQQWEKIERGEAGRG